MEETEKKRKVTEVDPGPGSGEVFRTVMDYGPTLEDSGRHWGVRVEGGGVRVERGGGSGGRCGVCKCPLSCVLSELHPGVLVFHCGKPLPR